MEKFQVEIKDGQIKVPRKLLKKMGFDPTNHDLVFDVVEKDGKQLLHVTKKLKPKSYMV